MVFAYYNRLSAARQRVYRASDALTTLALAPGIEWGSLVGRIAGALERERRPDVQRACQDLLDALVAAFRVPALKVKVHAARPAHDWGELHGLYEPDDHAPSLISLWMRTAQRRQVVAFRTVLRTLVHEFCHHLDYELFKLSETFHTEGFYKRESDLVKQLLESMAATETTLQGTT
jgi:hypothetical protein